MVRSRLNSSYSRILERSLKAIMPSTDFPFAVRLSVEMLAADGSEAMTALGAASLALADAGIPLKTQLAGVSRNSPNFLLISATHFLTQSAMRSFMPALIYCHPTNGAVVNQSLCAIKQASQYLLLIGDLAQKACTAYKAVLVTGSLAKPYCVLLLWNQLMLAQPLKHNMWTRCQSWTMPDCLAKMA